MLRYKPERFLTDNGTTVLAAGPLWMRFSAALSYRWEEIPVNDERMARSFPGSLYRLLFTAEPSASYAERFEFGRETNP